jgi:hypothetical protein
MEWCRPGRGRAGWGGWGGWGGWVGGGLGRAVSRSALPGPGPRAARGFFARSGHREVWTPASWGVGHGHGARSRCAVTVWRAGWAWIWNAAEWTPASEPRLGCRSRWQCSVTVIDGALCGHTVRPHATPHRAVTHTTPYGHTPHRAVAHTAPRAWLRSRGPCGRATANHTVAARRVTARGHDRARSHSARSRCAAAWSQLERVGSPAEPGRATAPGLPVYTGCNVHRRATTERELSFCSVGASLWTSALVWAWRAGHEGAEALATVRSRSAPSGGASLGLWRMGRMRCVTGRDGL